MSDPTNAKLDRAAAGLCADCIHTRLIESARGSRFLLCQLSATDPRFAKYPRLPVLACSGYQPNTAAPPRPRQ